MSLDRSQYSPVWARKELKDRSVPHPARIAHRAERIFGRRVCMCRATYRSNCTRTRFGRSSITNRPLPPGAARCCARGEHAAYWKPGIHSRAAPAHGRTLPIRAPIWPGFFTTIRERMEYVAMQHAAAMIPPRQRFLCKRTLTRHTAKKSATPKGCAEFHQRRRFWRSVPILVRAPSTSVLCHSGSRAASLFAAPQ